MHTYTRLTPWIALSMLIAVGATGAAADADKDKGKSKSAHALKHVGDQGQMRFHGMDEDGDGRITRAEWQGNDVSFANHDVDGDGVLSGAEVAPAGQASPEQLVVFDRFGVLDADHDGFVERGEWTGDRRTFRRLDANGDGRLTQEELFGMAERDELDRAELFGVWDHDDNNRLTLAEWHLDRNAFNLIDRDFDGVITRAEFMGRGQVAKADDDQDMDEDLNRSASFDELDRNDDGALTRDEWQGGPAVVERMDENDDGRVVWAEWESYFSQRFSAIDANSDGRINDAEWKWSGTTFARLDLDDDRALTRAEFILRGDDREEVAQAGGADLGAGTGISLQARFDRLDRNGDNRITPDEWPGSDQGFVLRDLNGDGVITKLELGRAVATSEDLGASRFDMLDRNRDGAVVRSEWRGDLDAFARLDRNADGRLTREEFFDPGHRTTRAELFQIWDHDEDGRLTRSEWHADEDAFERFDRDNDGVVTRSEFLRG